MTEELGRRPTKDEQAQARAVAIELVEALRTAPNVSVGICGIGLFVEQAFMHAVKPEFLLPSFDEWARVIRVELAKATRHAHN